MDSQYFLAVYVLLSVLLALEVVSQDSCQFNQMCSVLFVYSNFQLTGCPVISSKVSSKPMESLNCLSNTNCKALICNASTTLCSSCTGDQIKSLNFSSPGVYLKRKFLRLNMGYDPARLGREEYIAFPNGLVSGDLVYVKATPLKYDSFILDFLTRDGNITYHLRARCDDTCADYWNCSVNSCFRKYLIVSSLVNGNWDSSNLRRIDYTYSMKLNQPFELHLLFQSKYVLTFIDGVLYHNYTTLLPPQSIYTVRIGGTVDVHEFSL